MLSWIFEILKIAKKWTSFLFCFCWILNDEVGLLKDEKSIGGKNDKKKGIEPVDRLAIFHEDYGKQEEGMTDKKLSWIFLSILKNCKKC